MERQKTAHRPGTRAARASAIRLLLAFANEARIDYKRITYYQVCGFIEHLAQASYTPGSISNTVSHLRTFYKLADLPDASWNHYRVGLALRSIAINIRHTPKPKDPVTPAILKRILHHMNAAQNPLAMKLAILLMFMGFLRQSSIAPPTAASFDHTRHLTPADISPAPGGIRVKIKWTKTLQKSSDAKVILLPATKDHMICPVRAYEQYIHLRAPPPSGPLLIFEDGNPIPLRYINRQWAAILRAADLPPAAYSLHSLRRGAAGYTYNKARAKLNDVMTQGTWRSLAVRDYIKPPDAQENTVHKALKRL